MSHWPWPEDDKAAGFRTTLKSDPDPQTAGVKVAAVVAEQGSGGAPGMVTDRVKSDVLAAVETLRARTAVQQWVGTPGFGLLALRPATIRSSALRSHRSPRPPPSFTTARRRRFATGVFWHDHRHRPRRRTQPSVHEPALRLGTRGEATGSRILAATDGCPDCGQGSR
jgi:hypothetical protein